MIKKVWLRNFKPFDEHGCWIDLAPITLIFGANSTGKSSFLQSLILLKQSWESLPSIQTLSPEGSLLDLGKFKNIVHQQNTLRPIEIGLDLGESRAIFEFRGTEESSTGNLEQIRELAGLPAPWIPEREKDGTMSIKCDLLWENQGSVVDWLRENLSKIRAAWDERHPKQLSTGLRFFAKIQYYSIEFGFSIFCDTEEMEGGDKITSRHIVWTRSWFPDRTHLNDLDFFGIMSPSWDTEIEDAKFFDLWTAWKQNIEPHLQKSISFLRQELEQIFLIGRVRLPMARLIRERLPQEHLGVGNKGERTGALLLADPDLVEDVNDCLRKLHQAREEEPVLPRYEVVATNLEGNFTFGYIQLKHSVGNRELLLGVEDVGSAVGQLLPILVEWSRLRFQLGPTGDWEGSNATLLVEQPELHLHPALQAELISLIALQTQEDKNQGRAAPQVLLETHSEHMVLRLRKLVRNKEIHPEDVIILVFENKDGQAQITPLKLNEKGDFNRPWPNGFFPERRREIL